MKIAIIGSQGHYDIVFNALKELPEIEITALCGGRGEAHDALKEKCHEYGFKPKVYSSYTSLAENSDIDIVVVNPQYYKAAAISAYFLSSGVHVFSEKPLATDEEGLQHLGDVWDKSEADLGAMFNLSCSSWFKTAEKAYNEGTIGELRLIHAQKSYKLGERPGFYANRDYYGGMFPWVGIHAIDWALRFGGSCKSLYARQSSVANEGQGELETSGVLLMELENSIFATVSCDYFRPSGAARHDDDRLRLTGTRGMIEVVDGAVYIEDDKPKRILKLENADNCFTKFVRSLGTVEARNEARHCLYTTLVSLEARKSGDSGKIL